MRILHIGKYYPPVPGGMERVLQLLCERERAIVDSRVLVAGTEVATRREVVNGVPVTRAGTLATIGSVGLAPTLPLELGRCGADVIVIHEPNPVALVADFLTRGREPLVVYFHSEVVRPAWKYRLMYRPFLQRVLRRASRILVASPMMAIAAEQLEGFRQKCEVVPYGIELDSARTDTALDVRIRELRSRYGGPLALFVGRLVPYKGVDVLIRALAGTSARLVVVGDGPQAAPLAALARTAGVADRVVFAGAVDDTELRAHYHACDLLVLPSITRAEAFGMVQLEAMACGKPVVCTDLPSGVPWVNRDGESGLVVPPGDADALGRAIRALADNEVLRRRLGAGARLRVEREFTAARMAARTAAIYAEVLREDRASDAAQGAGAGIV